MLAIAANVFMALGWAFVVFAICKTIQDYKTIRR